MKKTLILGALLVGSLSAYSQGTINIADSKTDFTIHIYAPQTQNPSQEQTGNTSSDKLAGSTVYTGQLIGGASSGGGPYSYSDGADYTVQVYAAPGLNDAASALLPVTQYVTGFSTTAGAGQFKPVTFNTTSDIDHGIPNTSGDQATVAIAAWYNAGGTITSLADAITAGVPEGLSVLANFSNLGALGSPPATPPDLGEGSVPITSFSLAIVTPEPSTIALGVIGASTLLFRRRK
jgi:hypothetical protein